MKKDIVIAVISALVLIIIGQWVLMRRPAEKVSEVKGPAKFKGKIAIVLDDWGYNQNNLAAVKEIPYPFTASVLPNLPHTVPVAEALHELGKEIILHLPMEPNEKYSLEKNTILASMPEPEVKKIIQFDLDGLPYVKGVSNHMGSKITQNQKIMAMVMKDLKKRGMFFLDSLVSRKSVGESVAASLNLPFAKRDVFLDNTLERSAIRQQLTVLKKQAAARGSAIGVGHDRTLTLQVLKEMMPLLEKEGFTFVFVSELVN